MTNRLVPQWRSVLVLDSIAVSTRVRRIVLDMPPGAAPAGSHVDFKVPLGDGPRVRSYSVVMDGRHAEHINVAVQLEPNSRGGSLWMHGLRRGDRVTVSQPFNSFELSAGRTARVLLAGGIGITPLVGMARALRSRGSEYRLIYTGRTLADMPFADSLVDDHGDRAHIVQSSVQRLDLDRTIGEMPAGTELYVCGSTALLSAAQQVWAAHSRPPQLLRFETFGSIGSTSAVPFRVHIPTDDRVITVPADRTMLEALQDAGCEVMSDCLRGQCGLCAVAVLASDGALDHRDVFLSPRQKQLGEQVVLCVSRSAGGDISIDLP
jgi:ferredoxin-NADP reductase